MTFWYWRGRPFRCMGLPSVPFRIIGWSSWPPWNGFIDILFTVAFRFRSSEVHCDGTFNVFLCWPLPLGLACDGMVVVDLTVSVPGCLPVQREVAVFVRRGRRERSERQSVVEGRRGLLS